MTLQERAQAFLDCPIPIKLSQKHIPGSITEMLIAECSARIDTDAEGKALLSICVIESNEAVARYKTPEAKDYWASARAFWLQ